MPAVSPTVWVPVFRVSSPVEPPSPTFGVGVGVPSIWRLNRPGSLVGLRSLLTSSLPVSRVFVIVQTMSASVVTGTFSGPASSAACSATIAPVPLSSLQSIDFW